MMASPNSLSFSRTEAAVLKVLAGSKNMINVGELVERLGLDQAAIFGASTSLADKDLISVHESEGRYYRLTEEGKNCSKIGLPERIVIDYLMEKKRGTSEFESIKRELHLSDDEATIALGWLKRKNWATATRDGTKLFLKATNKPPKDAQEELITTLSTVPETSISSLDQEHRTAAELLLKRKLLDIAIRKTRLLEITSRGLEAIGSRREDS